MKLRQLVPWALIASAVTFVFWLVFFALPPRAVPSDVGKTRAERAKLRNDFRSTETQFLGGLALAAGLIFTWRTLRLNREGQLTDRFSKAIDQLGDEKLDVRLGGIYALERIARDSQRDHQPVTEVLTAYVRRYVRTESDPPKQAPPDIEAIATVLGRRVTQHERPPGERLDLRGADLRHVVLDEANLAYALLATADFSAATLTETDFREAFLQKASFRWAVCSGCDFRGARLYETDLSDAILMDCRIAGAESDSETKWPEGFDAKAEGVAPFDLTASVSSGERDSEAAEQ